MKKEVKPVVRNDGSVKFWLNRSWKYLDKLK